MPIRRGVLRFLAGAPRSTLRGNVRDPRIEPPVRLAPVEPRECFHHRAGQTVARIDQAAQRGVYQRAFRRPQQTRPGDRGAHAAPRKLRRQPLQLGVGGKQHRDVAASQVPDLSGPPIHDRRLFGRLEQALQTFRESLLRFCNASAARAARAPARVARQDEAASSVPRGLRPRPRRSRVARTQQRRAGCRRPPARAATASSSAAVRWRLQRCVPSWSWLP